MDYKVTVVYDDGTVEEWSGATSTDVENHIVYCARRAQATRSKMVTITISNLTVS